MSGKSSARLCQLIDDATSRKSGDSETYSEICQIINTNHDGPKEAAKCIRKRFATKNLDIIKPTLDVLDTCVKYCGKRFHLQVAQKEFIIDFLKLIKPKNTPSAELQSQVLGLLQSWAIAFKNSADLQDVVRTYEELKNKNMEFPPIDQTKPPEIFINIKDCDGVSMSDTCSVYSMKSTASGRSGMSAASGISGISVGSFLSPSRKGDRSPSPRYRITETIEVETNPGNGFLVPASTKRAASRSPAPRIRVAEPAERTGRDNFLAPSSGKQPRGSRSPSPMFQVLAPAAAEDNPQNSFLAPASGKAQHRDRSPSPRYRIVAPLVVDESETNNFLCPASAKTNKGNSYSPKSQSPTRVVQSELELTDVGAEIKKFREKSQIFGDMLSAAAPGTESSMDWELLTDLHSACRRIQERIAKLLTMPLEGGHAILLLKINEDLGNAFARYDERQRAAIEQMSGKLTNNNNQKEEEPRNNVALSVPTIQIEVDDLVNVVADDSNINKLNQISLSEGR